MTRLLVAVVALSLWAVPALAHKLKLFVTAEGADWVGTAYFAGGGPAAQVAGKVVAETGAELAQFRTDADGNFRVAAPATATIVVDAGDGHVTQIALAAISDASPALASTPAPAVGEIEAAVARQIRPLRLQLDAMEDRAHFSDIMGGIGTIFGVFGIAAWIAARRKVVS